MSSNTELTQQTYWENYWSQRGEQAVEIKRTPKGLSVNALLDVFDKYLPANKDLSVLEIGGAPGQYLIYLHKLFGYKVHSLDYSAEGNKRTIENLSKVNIPVQVYERNLMASDFDKDLPRFDIVYSLGFIEHFENTADIVQRHLRLVKPGGILVLGVPNLGGIYKRFLKTLAPEHLALHNLNAMKIGTWKSFEEKYNLKVIYRNYIGGFEPLVMKKMEGKGLLKLMIYKFVTLLMLIFSFNFSFLRKLNSQSFSGYLIGVYKAQ